jgi:hypothetical protein
MIAHEPVVPRSMWKIRTRSPVLRSRSKRIYDAHLPCVSNVQDNVRREAPSG